MLRIEGIEPSLLNDVSPATKLSGVLAALDISPSLSSGGLPGELDNLAIKSRDEKYTTIQLPSPLRFLMTTISSLVAIIEQYFYC